MMPTSLQILDMLRRLEITKAPYRSQDGGNYTNDHTPMEAHQAVKKIELFISFGGKVTVQADRILVAWNAHSEGLLEVFRVSEERYFVHGEITTG
jgi:hypothetical protein